MLCSSQLQFIYDKPSAQRAQRAIFQRGLAWEIDSVLSIYIYDDSNIRIVNKETGVPTELRWLDYSWVSPANRSQYFDPLYETIQGKVRPHELVRAVVETIFVPLVRLKFVFVDRPEDAVIRVRFDSTAGCNSFVGTQNLNIPVTRHTMNLSWLDVGTTIHEFCHALGMVHEHQNPRNNPIQWNEDVAYCYFHTVNGWDEATVHHNVLERYAEDEINGTEYDRASIMVYSFPRHVTMARDCMTFKKGESASLTADGMYVQPNFKLSPSDIQWLQYMYPASGVRDPSLPSTVIVSDVFDENRASVQLYKYRWWLIGGVGVVGVGVIVFILLKK